MLRFNWPWKRDHDVNLRLMNERRPLPLGLKEFEEWSDRIILGAHIPGVTVESQKWTLAVLLTQLPQSDSFKNDGYFIHCLRRAAVQQVADSVMRDIAAAKKARIEAEKALNSPEKSEKTPSEATN